MEATTHTKLVAPDEADDALGFTVLGNHAVVALLKLENVTMSGIEIAGQKEEKPSACIVLGVGSPFEVDGFVPEVGDRIVIHRHQATAVKLADERELYVITPQAVIGVLP